MGNCLVTKLLATVNNSSLVKLGAIIGSASANSTPTETSLAIRIDTGSNDSVILNILSGTGTFHSNVSSTIGDGEKTFTIPANTTNSGYAYLDGGNATFEILNKYNIKRINISETSRFRFNLDTFAYSTDIWGITAILDGPISVLSTMPNLTLFLAWEWSRLTGNLSEITNTELNTVFINSLNITGTTSDLARWTKIVNLDVKNSMITGDISELSTLTKLSTLKIYGTSITGDYRLLIEGYRENGRTSGTVEVYAPGYKSNITMGGYKVTSGSNTPCELSWSGTYMYFKCTDKLVYALGASSELKTAWENEGYIVHEF